MAGIGFVLRKLSQQDNLLGVVHGFAHASLASVGPWLLTIVSLSSIIIFTANAVPTPNLDNFRLVVIYNFAFSLVFSGPIVILLTRYLSDRIYEKEVKEAPGMLLGGLSIAYVTQLPLVLFFYFYYVEFGDGTRIAAVLNFFLITSLWIVGIFLSALKGYKFVTGSFAIGLLCSSLGAIWLAPIFDDAGMLAGFNFGLAIILFSLISRIFAEYPYAIVNPFGFLRFVHTYRILVVGGLVANFSIWIDKWIMWFAPAAETFGNRMIAYPDYDSAMFLAYLFTVPAMALFMFSVETSFFEKQFKFIQDIHHHVSLTRIRANHQAILSDLGQSARNLVVLQVSITITVILIVPYLFDALEINFTQLGMFRLGLLGAMFQIFFQFMFIVLSYFDLRKPVLFLHLLFLVTNAGFTLISIALGFPYYGYGYFLASLVTFMVTFVVTLRYLDQLPYQVFVRNNASVQ